MLSQPSPGTFAYHRGQYLKYLKGPGTVQRWVYNHWPAGEVFWDRWNARKEFHYGALERHCEQRVFGLFNELSGVEIHRFYGRVKHLAAQNTNITTDLSRIVHIGPNSITIFGVREEMGHWAQVIGEADWDVPWVPR